MKAYEVFLNGRHLVTAGLGLNGVLSTTVTCVSIPPGAAMEAAFDFSVRGMDGLTMEHIEWSVPKVGVGDEITIKIVETDQVTPEDHRRVLNPQMPGESMEDFAVRMKSEGWCDEADETGSP